MFKELHTNQQRQNFISKENCGFGTLGSKLKHQRGLIQHETEYQTRAKARPIFNKMKQNKTFASSTVLKTIKSKETRKTPVTACQCQTKG
jgi:hypothetical protein